MEVNMEVWKKLTLYIFCLSFQMEKTVPINFFMKNVVMYQMEP